VGRGLEEEDIAIVGSGGGRGGAGVEKGEVDEGDKGEVDEGDKGKAEEEGEGSGEID